MTVYSSDFAAGGYELGDLRPLPAFNRPGFFVENGQEWLRTGLLRANVGNAYADLLAVAPGYGVNFNVAADRVNAFSAPTQGTLVFSRITAYYTASGRYVFCAPPTDASAAVALRHNSDLTGAGTAVQVAGTAVTGHCYHNGKILFSTTDNTAGTGLKAFDSALANGTGLTTQQYAGVASNGTNLAVAIARSVPSNYGNGIQTTTDGLAWVPRTGTSGLLSAMVGIHYAPWLGKFFKWGYVGGGDAAILSTTDGYTDAVAMPTLVGYYVQFGSTYGSMQHAAASTPTATLIPVQRASDGMFGWLRTTDGTNWVLVSPFLDPTLQGINAYTSVLTAPMDLQYDAPRSRLVAFLSAPTNTSGDWPAFFFSVDNGSTWQAGPAFDDVDTSITRFLGFSYVNGQDLAHVGAGATAAQYRYSYPASKFSQTPSYVGTLSAYGPGSGNVFYSIRIK